MSLYLYFLQGAERHKKVLSHWQNFMAPYFNLIKMFHFKRYLFYLFLMVVYHTIVSRTPLQDRHEGPLKARNKT